MVRLIPPQYVEPFVRRGKNDRNDAEAICKAASRPGMPGVPVKATEQQADAVVLSPRELLVRQRTQLVNAIRGHAAEFGIVAARSISHVPALLDAVMAGAAVPAAAKEMLRFWAPRWPSSTSSPKRATFAAGIEELERGMKQQHKANPVSQPLAEMPGIGPTIALSLTLTVDPGRSPPGGTSRPGWASCRRSTRPAGASAWAVSAEPATSGCGNCWSSARGRWSATPSQGTKAPRPGCWPCWNASSRRWLWPTGWPTSRGL